MAALVSCPKHNMVACLEKTERNAQFHEIVDFLTRSSIYYSLTVSPTVSTSLIEQFWNTATSKTVNDVSYIKAKVAGKTVSISEASIRRDLLFNDVDGIDCLTNQEIYENLQLMGSKSTSWDQFPTNIASALICLATDRKFNFSKMIFEGMIRNLDAKKQFLMYPRFVQVFLNNQLSNLPAPLDNLPIPVLTKKVFTNMAKQGLHFSGHVTPLFPNMLAQAVVDEGEGSAQPTEPQPTPSPTQPSTGDQPPGTESSYRPDTTQVLRDYLEGTDGSKGDQKRIKKLEKKCKPSISHHRAWLKSVQRLSMKKRLGKKESISKQGRKNAKSKPTLGAFDDLDLAHGMDYMETEKAVNEGRPDVDAARQEVSAVEPRTPPTTTSIFDDEDITMAQTLIKMKEEKAKEKGVAFKDVEDSSRPARSVLTLKPLPSIDPKDKRKGILVEEEPVKVKRKDQGIDQIERDEELAYKLHEEELAEITRIQDEKVAQEEASRVAILEMFDEVQAVAQRKFRAAQRAAEIRSSPPTKSQLRNLMMTYLKNMGGYKHSQLKAKTLEEVQAMYERHKKKINDFKPMDSDDAVKDSKKAAGEDTSKKEEVLKEPNSTKIESMNKEDAGERVLDVSKKRKRGPRMKRMSKRKKTESDPKEEEDLKTFLKIVPDKEGIIDYELGSFYENYGVHTLTLEDGTEVHMLAERKYPLTKETLERVMSLKLIAESVSDSAYDLLRFIQKKIDEAGSHDGGEKDL
ncbi:hypothetical protein Tco_0566378 [Tanacetum coccineum]